MLLEIISFGCLLVLNIHLADLISNFAIPSFLGQSVYSRFLAHKMLMTMLLFFCGFFGVIFYFYVHRGQSFVTVIWPKILSTLRLIR